VDCANRKLFNEKEGSFMEKRTVISVIILVIFVGLLVGFSVAIPGLWTNHLSHLIITPVVGLIMTLLVGLVLMDGLFELDYAFVITIKRFNLKIEIRQYLVWAFVLVCAVAIVLEVVQFFLSPGTVHWIDPVMALAGAVAGIVLHIIGSKCLMKRVEFELERWEDNVL
jgi:hypothetical protein